MEAEEDFSELLCTEDLDGLPVAPVRFRYQFEGEDGNRVRKRLDELLLQLEADIAFAELPDEVKGHPFYIALFQKRLSRQTKSKKAFQHARRNHARLISHRPDEARVQVLVEQFAQNILEYIETHKEPHIVEEKREKAVKNIQRSVNALIRENLEAIGSTPLFYMGRSRGGKDHLKSTFEVKKAVMKVKHQVERGEIDRKNASIAVLLELGAVTQKELRGREKNCAAFNLEDCDLKEWNEGINRSLHWARALANRKMEWIASLIRRYATEGKMEGKLTLPSLNNALREDDVFDLLDKFFTQDLSPRDANDIQVILNLALAHWTHVRFYQSKEKLESFERIKSTILEFLFKTDEDGEYLIEDHAGPLLGFDPSEERFYKLAHAEEVQPVYEVKPLHCPRGKKIRMYSYFMGTKPEEACVMKNWDDDKGDMTPDALPDFFRTRFVLWGITSKQILENEEMIGSVRRMLDKLAERLNLSGLNIKGPKPDDKFVKWKFNGVSPEGIPIEIQIVPHDSYLFDTTPGSALSHDVYAEQRDIDHWDQFIPPSISRNSHTALRLRKQELGVRTQKTMKAMSEFDYSSIQTSA